MAVKSEQENNSLLKMLYLAMIITNKIAGYYARQFVALI